LLYILEALSLDLSQKTGCPGGRFLWFPSIPTSSAGIYHNQAMTASNTSIILPFNIVCSVATDSVVKNIFPLYFPYSCGEMRLSPLVPRPQLCPLHQPWMMVEENGNWQRKMEVLD
jgi:hypothetical protein